MALVAALLPLWAASAWEANSDGDEPVTDGVVSDATDGEMVAAGTVTSGGDAGDDDAAVCPTWGIAIGSGIDAATAGAVAASVGVAGVDCTPVAAGTAPAFDGALVLTVGWALAALGSAVAGIADGATGANDSSSTRGVWLVETLALCQSSAPLAGADSCAAG